MTITLLLSAALALSGAMWLAWTLERATGKSGWIDAIWSAATGLTAAAAIAFLDNGTPERKWAAAALVTGWSLRLAFHIAARNFAVGDDPRYKALREEWGARAAMRMAWFLQVQAAAGLVLVIAILAAASNPAAFPHWLDIFAILLGIGALAGEAIADRQLAIFRKAQPPGSVMEEGLWRYSRHPNYFFEWLWWTAWPVMALAGWNTALPQMPAFAAPALMYVLLVHVSGLPPLEAHMMRSRGEAYRALQKRVNAFFPGPRRESQSGPITRAN